MKNIIILILTIFVLIGCGGGSSKSYYNNTSPKSGFEKIYTLTQYSKKLNFNSSGKYVLQNAPKGMAVYPNGTLVWTPTNKQAGNYAVKANLVKDGSVIESKKLNLKVIDSGKSYDGVFIDLSGKNGGDGSPQNPYGTFKEACENLNGLHNIYIRGGVYKNPGYHKDYGKSGRFPAIEANCQGTKSNPIVIRPWGNEYVKLKTDALYGIKIKPGAKYITVQNLEIEGEAEDITLDTALKYWWQDNNDTMQSTGISASGDNIVIKDNVIHAMSGSGISVSAGKYATVEGNIVYDCDWWTIAGSKGIGITSARGSDANGGYKNKIINNLVFNVEQRVMSHVWKKGFATLTIDEGEALLIQEGKQANDTQSNSYNGKYLVKDNILLYNGKTAVSNLAKDVNFINNTLYNNGGATKQAGFRVGHSKNINIENNAIESNISQTVLYSCDNSSSNINLINNYAKGVIANSSIDGIKSVNKLFNDPKNFDFSIVSNLPQNIGAGKDAIINIKKKLKLYNIKVQRKHLKVNQANETKYIAEHAPGKIDCSHYNDEKDPYILITDINSSHTLVKDLGITQFKLYIKHKFGECIDRADSLNDADTKEASFIDSKVIHAKYSDNCGHSGYTDSNGIFKYKKGCDVSFWAGNVYLGKAKPIEVPKNLHLKTKTYVTPLLLAGKKRIDDSKVIKIVKFLMAIDKDSNASNGIEIPKESILLKNKQSAQEYKFSDEDEAPSTVEAKEHLFHTLHKNFTDTLNKEINKFETFFYNPKINDSNLKYSIKNRPSWLNFNTKNGILRGVANIAGEYKDIEISATDNKNNNFIVAKLNITVNPPLNLAHLFGKASQGSEYGNSYPAENVLDDNNDTFNHTLNNSKTNWLQIKLPEGVEIKEIVIVNRNSYMSRLNGAKVYLSNKSYNGILNKDNLIGTLSADLEQKFNFKIPKKGSYVLIKAKGNNYLHIAQVQVYGTFGNKPYIIHKNETFGLDFNATAGAYVGKIEAKAKSNKTLRYKILDNVPFKINSKGVIILNGKLNHNVTPSYSFKVKVSNGSLWDTANVNVKLLSKNGVNAWRWSGIEGNSINSFLSSAHYKNDSPDKSFYLDKIDFNANKEDNFGQKMSTVLRVPKSGFYTFAIIGDNSCRLDFNGIKNFAYKSSRGNYQDWKNAGKSKKVYLQKGEIYPLTAYLKESSGQESISAGWKMPGKDSFTVIGAKYLYKEELNITNIKPHFLNNINKFNILESKDSIGDTVLNLKASDSQDELTYTIIGDVPFTIDNNGNIIISGSLEVKDYQFDVKASDGTNETIRHIVIHSPVNTKSLNEAKEEFYERARVFDGNKSVDELVESFLAYAHKKAKNDYSLYISEALNPKVWQFIEENPSVKEGLYASRFPVNPYSIKNLGDFLDKWKEEGKSDAFIQKYKNVALGLAINAKERGIFKEALFGDTGDHKVVDYLDIPKMEAKKRRWLEHFDFKNLGYGISKSKFIDMLYIYYKLSKSERESIRTAGAKLKKAFNDGYSVNDITPDIRKTYNISYDELNVYRILSGLNRLECYAQGNPCAKIDAFIENENNDTLTKSYILANFKKYKNKIGLISARDDMNWELAGEIGIVPKNQKDYRLMPFYDLANMKIANDEIPAKDFNDSEPNWPLFNYPLSKLPWQILALEQSAQKKECNYVKNRFFETDKAKLRESYPPNAVDGGKKAEKRFIQYTTYTWDYDKPEVWFRKSDWSPHRTVYRVLQDGGVCGRQSTMGQHVNECLNRPSIGTGQPGHRAWVGVFLSKDNPEQFYTTIGYKVGSRESATPHSRTIYNQYTSEIRENGLERFTGVVTGVSQASAGEHKYNQSMILQHISKLMEKENSASAEALLKKAIELVPQNTDAWYQLSLYYAKLDEPEKIIALANEYMQKRDTFFMEPNNRKGADNLEIVTGKNIAFSINLAPGINYGKGEKAEWGKEQLWKYLDKYEKNYRSIRSYRNQNRYLANYYLGKLKDKGAFKDAVKELFNRFLNNSSTGNYNDYFKGVNFADVNKTELFDTLEEMTDSAQISDKKRSDIYSKILERDLTKPLAQVNMNDICLDENLSKCQSRQEFTLNAKAIYITVDKQIGEDTEVNPTDRGKEAYSILSVPCVDDLGNDKNIIVRVAKIGNNGKLLKINDPSEVKGDSTKIVAWISSEDNNLAEGRSYTSRQRVILHIKKRVTDNEEKMGIAVLNIINLIQGKTQVINNADYTGETIKDSESSVYFTALKNSIGPTKGVWWKKGYSTLNVPVKDKDGNKFIMHLRGYNNNDYKMNSGLSKSWDNTLSIKYFSEDNPDLKSGERYKSIMPFTIDAKMWHKEDKIKKRYYFSIDLKTP